MKHLLALAVALTPAIAEEVDFNAQLKRAQRTFERQAATVLLPEYERYVSELASLERTLVSYEDFKGAAAVQAERQKIRSLIAATKKPTSIKRRSHTFKKDDATSKGNTLTWAPKSPIPPGGYKISLAPEAKEAIISEGFHTAKPGQTLRITTGKTITITLTKGMDFTQLTLTPGA